MQRNVLSAIVFAAMFAVLIPLPASASVSVGVSISYFHDTLAPYGRWVVADPYGEVWVPSGIAPGWDPYWDGEWIWSDYGWTWVSYDPWGDIPYHYGTWVWLEPYGWVWEPGTVWAPAWVTWAWTDDYIGWAPVPATFVITTSGYAGPPVVVVPTRYVFVPATQFVGVNVSTVRVPETQNAVLLPRARKATRFTVSGGIVRATTDPPPSFVERARGKRLIRVGIGKVKSRPTTLGAARISGKRIGVVASGSERGAAITRAKPSTKESKAKAATREKEARVTSSRAAARSKARSKASTPRSEKTERRAPKIPKEAVREPVARKEAVHEMTIHRDADRSGSAPPAVYKHEARPPREAPPRSVAPQASSPETHGNPHAVPPGRAARPQAQPQPAAQAPKGKEKKKGRG